MTRKKTILFMVTNGAGLGHLTRGLAIARKLRALDSSLEIVFFTTSVATEVIRREGFMYFYIPTKAFLKEHMNMNQWNDMVQRCLAEIIALYHPVELVYDGVLPYKGLLQEMQYHGEMTTTWIKREGYKEGWRGIDGIEKEFNHVIIPMEFDENYKDKTETEQRRYCHPITFLDESEAYERQRVREALGIKNNEQLFYVQLGAGTINDIQKPLEAIQKSLLKLKHTKVVIAESMIGLPIRPINEAIKVLRNYPNSQYFKGFDFAISAGGYNTVNELIRFKVPSLFIPNEATQIDDQRRRVKDLEEKKMALVVNHLEDIDDKIEALIKQKTLIKDRLKSLNEPNGAVKAAELIKAYISK